MIKKVFVLSAFFLILIMPVVFAANNTGVNKAYDCLEEKVDDCSSLSLRAQIFSLLTIGECRSEVLDASKDDECWPKANCDIKTTAQAILALGGSSDAEEWLLSQTQVPSGMNWYLQIEITNGEVSACEISYNSESYSVNIGEDKKINSDAGECLALAQGDYWLEISPDCYDNEIEISCDQDFFTSLLFKKEDSAVIHVSSELNSASAEGTTTEKINSFCFSDEGMCDYEGSLWAALVLDSLDEETETYLPYLITMADENEAVLPEVFLYALTDYEDFHYDLISKQTSVGYWQKSGNKFYDTALVLTVLEESDERTEAEEWLLKIQDKDGCWNSGNVRDTAFILYATWPKYSSDGGGEIVADCDDMNYSCMSGAACTNAGGTELDYECPGLSVCCDTPAVLETCVDMGGIICGTGEECTGITQEASDTSECCFDSCEEPVEILDCEFYGGFCEPFECGEGYEESYDYECEYSGDVCCMEKTEPEPKRILLWILIILIILIILGIIFRKKLREFWFRLKSGKSKPKKRPSAPPFFPHHRTHPRRITSRQILPSAYAPPRHPHARRPERTHKELDEVLKKLKEMGK